VKQILQHHASVISVTGIRLSSVSVSTRTEEVYLFRSQTNPRKQQRIVRLLQVVWCNNIVVLIVLLQMSEALTL